MYGNPDDPAIRALIIRMACRAAARSDLIVESVGIARDGLTRRLVIAASSDANDHYSTVGHVEFSVDEPLINLAEAIQIITHEMRRTLDAWRLPPPKPR